MSLNWNLSKIKDCDAVCWTQTKDGKKLKSVTEALLWLTVAVGIGDITEKNAQEFYDRLHAWELVSGKSIIEPLSCPACKQLIGKDAETLKKFEESKGPLLKGQDGERESATGTCPFCLYRTAGEQNSRHITLEEVKMHIGLHTNVFPKETVRRFANKLASVALEHLGVDRRFAVQFRK